MGGEGLFHFAGNSQPIIEEIQDINASKNLE